MRKKVSTALLGVAGLVGSTVVTMIWPSISPGLGFPILGLCLLAIVVAAVLLIPDLPRTWDQVKGIEPGIVFRKARIQFDPVHRTEMAVFFELVNTGPQVGLAEVYLKAFDPLGDALLIPTVARTGRNLTVPMGDRGGHMRPHYETLTERPFVQGERLDQCLLGFSASGDARTLYGSPRNKFAIIAKDTLGRTITAQATIV